MTDKSPVIQTKLSNGTLVDVNDHVYLTPEHLGEPYYIGRVMEFCHVPNRKGLQVRVAWYSRPKDVFNRKRYDSAMLIATMNSDLNPVSSIRGKCVVLHKHYIPNDRFESYKFQEDCFYYTQMYDRYMQRVYDLLPCELVENVPMDVQEALRQRYQFVVVEQGKAADLTGARRTCCICQTWCNSTRSVRCAGCQKSFHMACLTPPLTRKPSKGFAWQCAFCSKKELENLVVSSPGSANDSTTPSRSASPGKRTVRLRSQQQQQQQQQQQIEKPKKSKHSPESSKSSTKKPSSISNNLKIFENPNQIKTTHMWPFRYFGVNTNSKDILDIDDRIYPRAASRIGSKYQATVADWDHYHDTNTVAASSPKKSSGHSPSSFSSTSPQSSITDDSLDLEHYENACSSNRTKRTERRGKPNKRKDSSLNPHVDDHSTTPEDGNTTIRGTDDTATALFSQPARLNDKELDQYISKVQSLPNLPLAPYSADTFDLALSMLEENDYDTTAALKKISRVTKDDFKFLATWQANEIDAFEQGIQEHGHELHFIKQRIPTKSIADIVRFFYQWKKSDRYEPIYSVWTKVFRPTKQFKKNTRSIIECLGKAQQKDDTLIKQLVAQSKIGMTTNDSSDDETDKDYKMKIAQPKQQATTTRPIRSTRTTRQSAALAAAAQKETIQTSTKNEDQGTGKSDPSIIPPNATTKNDLPFECHYCHTTDSKIWRRVPGDTDRKQKVFDRALCDACGTHWLKYAKKRTAHEVEPIASTISPRSRSRIAVKRKHPDSDTGLDGGKRTKEMTKLFAPCQVCYSTDQPKQLISCIDCQLVVHDDCFGIGKDDTEHWRCDVCRNRRKPVVSYFYQCILCGNDPDKKQEAMKATSGYNWAHITCALFFPQIKFINPSTMSPIEFAGSLSNKDGKQACQVCNRSDRGSCIPCSDEDCDVHMHGQCALKHGYQAGFVIDTSLATSPKYEHDPAIESGTFGKSSPKGVMIPKIYCPRHNVSSYKHFYPMTTRTPGNKSWIAIYADLYKSTDLTTTPAMRRYYSYCLQNGLDLPSYHKHNLPSSTDRNIQAGRRKGTHHNDLYLSTLLNPSCSQCSVTSSPFWWNSDDVGHSPKLRSKRLTSNQKLCQRCHIQQLLMHQQNVII